VTANTSTVADAASKVPGADTYTVGFCVQNFYPGSITSDHVNGWVQVTN